MFSTSVIPTVGRPSLSRAVTSVLEQGLASEGLAYEGLEYEGVEVVVVNDSGHPLPREAWQADERVRVVDTQCRERSVARNTGAALARGRYLHFLDDDDWLLPGGLKSLWEMARSSNAAWLYGSTQLVDRQEKEIIRLAHGLSGNCFAPVMAGEWIPLQSSLVEREAFWSVGGFDPTIAGPEDIDLCRRMALRWDLAETSELVACVAVGQEGSTTDYGRHEQERRWVRERLLDERGVLARLISSARSSPPPRGYWYGRAARVYWTSVVWNARQKRPLRAASRAALGTASLVVAGRHLLSPDFWQALGEQYKNLTFTRGFEQARGGG